MSDKDIYTKLADTIGTAGSSTIIKILKQIADEKAARIVYASSPPATVEQIAQKTGYKESEVLECLDEMFIKGLIFKSRKPDAIRYYRFKNLLQFHDANLSTPNLPVELINLWRDFNRNEWPGALRGIEKEIDAPIARVVPVNESISPSAEIMPFDDISKLVNSSYRIAVVNCTCRLVDGTCGLPLENCIQLNKAADYTVERKTGREITVEETLTILEEARKAGLVHVVDNQRGAGHIICNCCSDCCINWPDPDNYRQLFVAPSPYVATINADACSSCENCIERCFFDAIFMNGDEDLVEVIEDKCMGCGLCQVTCDDIAISLVEKRAVEFVPT